MVRCDQLLGRLHEVSGKGDPIEVGDDEASVGAEDAGRFPRRARTVEPVPALAGRHHVDRPGAELGLLGRRLPVLDLDARLGVEPPRLREHGTGRIDPDHLASPAREAAGERTRPRPEVDDDLARYTDPDEGEPIEQRGGEPGAVLPVVLGRLAEIGREATQR